MRNFSSLDQWITSFDQGLKATLGSAVSKRPNPAQNITDHILTEKDQKKAAALMRVNHVGEICAQALYQGQSLTVPAKPIRHLLLQSAQEEIDHLVWCQERLAELNSHPSYLNFLWYGGAFLIGVTFGLSPREVNLGFVAETERQVIIHIDKHLETLPPKDLRSRAILAQMRADEAHHAISALNAGGKSLPRGIQLLMRATAKVMTTVAYWI